MRDPFSMILFENKHNTWLIHFILLKHKFNSSFIQNYTKIKICVLLLSSTVQSRGLFTSPLKPVDNFSHPPQIHSPVCSKAHRGILFSPAEPGRIRGGSTVDPPTSPSYLCNSTASQRRADNDVIMIDS